MDTKVMTQIIQKSKTENTLNYTQTLWIRHLQNKNNTQKVLY